jgi:hypothetical protein
MALDVEACTERSALAMYNGGNMESGGDGTVLDPRGSNSPWCSAAQQNRPILLGSPTLSGGLNFRYRARSVSGKSYDAAITLFRQSFIDRMPKVLLPEGLGQSRVRGTRILGQLGKTGG